MVKPATLDEYRDWARATLSIDYDLARIKARYDTNIQTALNTIQKSSFWLTLPALLDQRKTEHDARTGAAMLMSREVNLEAKPYSSSIDKSFRHNILWNRRFPEEPKDGWATPDSWYMLFDDLIRSTIVCKFIDGPGIIAMALSERAMQTGLECHYSPRANERGYYAFHHYTKFPMEIADADFNPRPVNLTLELQLTTQLQEVLRELTHPLYERARLTSEPRDDKWKWEYENPKFQTSYLGHTLHLIEAIIIQVRDTANKRQSPSPDEPIDPHGADQKLSTVLRPDIEAQIETENQE
jgi:hypothetical protein